jgi:hypothetical protein
MFIGFTTKLTSPSFKIGRFYFSWGFGKNRFNVHFAKGVPMSGGVFNTVSVRLGKMALLWESPCTATVA